MSQETPEDERPTLIVEGLIIHRTPAARSLLFADEEARDLWLGDWDAAWIVVGIMFFGMLGSRYLLSEAEHQMLGIGGSLAFGLVIMAVRSVITRVRLQGRFERLSLERSVALDMRPIGLRPTLEAAGAGLVCFGIVGLIVWFAPWVKWYWRDPHLWALGLGGVLLFGFCGAALAHMAWTRAQYSRIRKRLLAEGG